MSAIEQYWSAISRQLQIDSELINGLIAHNGERGRANEISLSKILEKLLPPNLAIGTGIVFDYNGAESKQCDLIVYDTLLTPQFMSQSTHFLHPIDTVELVIEVKTTLTSGECEDIKYKAERLHSLNRVNESDAPEYSLFAYSSDTQPATTNKHFKRNKLDSSLAHACILDPGLVHSADITHGLEAVHFLNDSGDGSECIELDGFKNEYFLDGARYPVASTGTKPLKDLIVFDPGRALLLYCLSILKGLVRRSRVGSDWWSSYLTNSSTNTLELDS